jgi:hypothetical protein
VVQNTRNLTLWEEFGNHKMGMREFSENVMHNMNSIENDWKHHSHSEDKVALFKTIKS